MGLTLGLVGCGETSSKSAIALIEDYIESTNETDVRLVFAVSDAEWSEVHDDIYDWTLQKGYPYGVAYDQDAAEDKSLRVIIEDADEQVQVQRVNHKVATMLSTAKGKAALLILWSDHDEDYEVAEIAHKRDIPVFDLCDGLERLLFANVGDDVPDLGFPTREELDAIEDRDELKRLAQEAGLEISDRARTNTFRDLLDEHYRAKEAEAADAAVEVGDEDEDEDESPHEPVVAEPEPEPARATEADGSAVEAIATLIEQTEVTLGNTLTDLIEKVNAQLTDLVDEVGKAVAELAEVVAEIKSDVDANATKLNTITTKVTAIHDLVAKSIARPAESVKDAAEESPAEKKAERRPVRRIRKPRAA